MNSKNNQKILMDKVVEEDSIFYKGYSLKKYLTTYTSSIHIDSHSIKENFRKVMKQILWP